MSTTTSRHAARREPRFSFLRGRKGQAEAPQAPVAAAPFEGASEVGLMPAPVGDDTLLFCVPSPDGGPGLVLPPGPPWERPEAEEDAEAPLPVRTPGATLDDVAVPVLRTEPADLDLLRDLRDAIEALPCDPEPHPLPATLLRAVPRDGGEGSSKEILAGWPEYAGVRATETGQWVAGLQVGGDGDVQVHLENPGRDWWGRLAYEALRAQFAGVRGPELVWLWDEHIAWAMSMRDAQVYGGFPGGEPAPAAETEAAADAEDGEAA